MASASGSVCASTGASPATAVTPVGTGQSAPRAQAQPRRPVAQHLVAKETTTVTGGGGVTGDGVAAAAAVVILDEETEDDGTCSAEVEPAAKRQKRSTSKVWDYFTKSTVTEKNDDGQEEKQTGRMDKYGHCAPSDDEWTKAESFCKCLKTLNDLTVLFSGSQYPTANLFWWKFCDLKLQIGEWCASVDTNIASMAEAMQKKYDKYWKKSNIALAVACFLDPRYKLKLVEYFMLKIYKENAHAEISRFKKVVNQLFQAYLCSTRESSNSNAQHEPSAATINRGPNAEVEEFLYEEEAATNQGEVNELDAYMKEKPFRWVDPTGKGAEFDILQWWKTSQAKNPVLSRLARDVLAVQVSTVASESAFSCSGRIVNKFWSRLEPEVVEGLVCTKDWTIGSKNRNAKVASILDELLDDKDSTFTNEAENKDTENQTTEDGNGEEDSDNDDDNDMDWLASPY